ncbi:unnamed protein product [[Candida] boidinii]|nr:unnamed protein product [[Candida] boidinii]
MFFFKNNKNSPINVKISCETSTYSFSKNWKINGKVSNNLETVKFLNSILDNSSFELLSKIETSCDPKVSTNFEKAILTSKFEEEAPFDLKFN